MVGLAHMDCIPRVPVTSAVFAALAMLLSGCIAYDAAGAVVSAGSSVVGAGVSVAGGVGDVVTSPFDSDEPKKK
jgi:hypothetical protein